MSTKKEDLIKLIQGETDLKQILNKAYTIINNPISVIDLTYALQANSPNKKDDDPLWNELIHTGRFSFETVDFFKTEGFIEAYAMNETLAVMKSDKLKYDRVSCTIYDRNDVQLGSACLVECEKSLESEDYELFATLCEYIGSTMSLSKPEYTLEQRSAFLALIEGKANIRKAVNNLKKLNFKEYDYMYVAVADVYNYDNTLTHLEYFCDAFSRIDDKFSYFSYLNNVIILYCTSTPILNIKKEFSKLNEFFREYNINAGVSGVFNSFIEIKKHFKNALNALNYATSMSESENISFYDDYRLGFSLGDSYELEKICHPMALMICEYDMQNNTSYLATIHSYCKAALTTNNSLPDVSEVEAKFGIDFKDERMLFSIYVSIKYIRFFPEKTKKYLEKFN